MGINALTARRLADQRRKEQIKQVMKKTITCPVYYEVHSGIMDYRTGNWIRHDYVDKFGTLINARAELKWRFNRPKEGQNACYIVRRYRHENQNTTEAMESIHETT